MRGAIPPFLLYDFVAYLGKSLPIYPYLSRASNWLINSLLLKVRGHQSAERVGRFAVCRSPLTLALSQKLQVLKYRD
jgi:hypothetical protein